MPKLRCSAESCIHNSDACCCRGEINVAGSEAGASHETCCSNFYEDSGNAKDAVSQEPTIDMEIQCEAQNCTYNSNCKCHADCVDMTGYGANVSDETSCASFKPGY